MKEFIVKPIGFIRSEHSIAENTPIQPVFASECKGFIILEPGYEKGLIDISGFSHLIILYILHQAKDPELFVKPFLDDKKHGVFATRSPNRPNHIGLSIVQLLNHNSSILTIAGADILDGTPVIDIKPYSTRFDCFPDAKCGWMDSISNEDALIRGRRGYKSIDTKDNIP